MEVGSSNVMFYWKNKEGVEEVVTPKADDLILHGVTRDSVINIIRDMNEMPVIERDISIHEVIEAVNEGRMKEIFACGTAVTVGPVNRFKYKDIDYHIPVDPEL